MILGTPLMTSTKTRGNLNASLDNTGLKRVKFTKFLGVLIETLVSCHVMNKLKHYVLYRILHTSYCTLILPYLSYGILIWGNTSKSYSDKLVKFQKWAIRTISNSHYRSHTGLNGHIS